MEHFFEPSGAIKHSFIEECHQLGQLIYWHKQGNYSIQVRQLNQLRWLLINETLQSVIEKRQPNRFFSLIYNILRSSGRNLMNLKKF